MLDIVLGLIETQLNQHLRQRFRLNEDLARVGPLREQDGSPVPQSEGKVLVFLVGFEASDPSRRVIDAETRGPEQRRSSSRPGWNLLVMCAANFGGNNYPEALRFLSSTIQFFEDHPVLTPENCPGMDPQLGKLLLGIEHLPAPELASLWRMHNDGRYLPSVICRVRAFGSLSDA